MTPAQHRELLIECRCKLQLYREQHSGEYVGGMEYTALRREIDKAIAELAPAGEEPR